MRPQFAIVQRRPIILSEEDLHLTPFSRRKHQVRKLMKLIAFLAAPLFIAQSLAFASFIYEEGLQTASFAVRAAIQAEDQAIAYDAVKNYEHLMRQAQWFQKHLGCLAFWSHDAFYQYFYAAAPGQLAGMYIEGKNRGLWGDHPARWATLIDRWGNESRIDTWRADPIKRLNDLGFDPEIVNNPAHCLRCRTIDKAPNSTPAEYARLKELQLAMKKSLIHKP